MAAYLAQRIIDGVYTYEYVISKRPDLKERIDAYLREKGREDLITQQDDTATHGIADKSTLLTTNKNTMVATLWRAVQELKQENDQLKERIVKLEANV